MMMASDPEKGKFDSDDARDVVILDLMKEVSELKEQLLLTKNYDSSVYASELSQLGPEEAMEIPKYGRNPRHVKEYIQSFHELDNRPRLNTSSVGSY